MMLSDFDAAHLHETIPFFHDTVHRYEDLMDVVRANPLHRVEQVPDELTWLLAVRDQACSLTLMQQKGELPVRVTHNDIKINNVLFEESGKEAIVVIDLDTVMPGLVGCDFGDAIRSSANTAEEDCPESDKVHIDLDVFRASMTARALCKQQLKTLPLSSFCMTCELATRFLTDYLQGDTYFKVDYPGHNLVRARSQIALAKDILQNLSQMGNVIAECTKQYVSLEA